MSSTNSFYHRSKMPMEIGTVLRGRGLPSNVPEIEDAFEARRPAHCLSRRAAVFMSDHREVGLHGVEGDYVYRLEPLGPIEKYDNDWYGTVQKAYMKKKYSGTPEGRLLKAYPDWTLDLLERCATSYWEGIPSNKPNWEYLVPEARLLELMRP